MLRWSIIFTVYLAFYQYPAQNSALPHKAHKSFNKSQIPNSSAYK